MEHRERYRGIVPETPDGAVNYIISYSDLAKVTTPKMAEKVAMSIYYPLGGSYSSEAMDDGTKAHKIKEQEVGEWENELRLAYKMDIGYYLCGTIDRYHKSGIVEDFKTTTSPASKYLTTSQVETYAFLAMNNDRVVEGGKYTTIDKDGSVLDEATVTIDAPTVVTCYSRFILPRFNMIKREIERLKNQYVERTDSSDTSSSDESGGV